MRGSTLIMLFFALLFGAFAVVVAKYWLQLQQQAARALPTPKAAQVETSTLVVAGEDLRFGAVLTEDSMREIAWPKDAVPQGAFAKVADVIKDGRRVVLSPIAPNEPLLAWKISGPGARASLSALVTEGMRAVTVRLNDFSGVAGFVLPGDRVDVLYTRNDADPSIDVLLQNVRVLAIDQTADEKKAEPIEGKVATLELTPIDAQKLALAQSTGALTLTLRSVGSLDEAPAQRIMAAQLVSNASVYQTAIAGLAGMQSNFFHAILEAGKAKIVPAAAAVEETLPTTAQITIFRGLDSASYTVPLDANR